MGLSSHGRRGAKRLAERLSERRALRWRRPPEIRTGASGGTPTVYYLCPDYPAPSGGIRTIYRHVDILNTAGRSAAVLHHSDGYACRWFEHSTRIVGAPSARLSARDVLVVPEIYGPFLQELPREPRLVVFNQNAYLSFEHVRSRSAISYDLFDAALTVSEDSAEFLRFAFPGLEVSIVDYAIDPDVFYPAPEVPARRLALMPRKRPEDARQILWLLGERLRGWEVAPIENASESETAALLRDSPIFLALGWREGFGLPPAEAMASGCYAVGFSGFGGRELFDPSFSKPIEDGDVLAAARELAELLSLYERHPGVVREAGARAAGQIRERYSLGRQAEAVVAFYDELG